MVDRLKKCNFVWVFTCLYIQQPNLYFIKRILYNLLHYYIQLYNRNILTIKKYQSLEDENSSIWGNQFIYHTFLQKENKNGI